MSRLRVAIDARYMKAGYGGVEQVVIGLASGLSTLTDGNEEYLFLAHEDSEQQLRAYLRGPCKILRAGRAQPSSWSNLVNAVTPALGRVLDRLHPSIVRRLVRVSSSDGLIESTNIDVMHFTFQTAFRTNIPSIYHPHDLQHIHLPQFFSRHARIVRDVRYQTFCAQAQMVAVTSSWVKRDLLTQYKLPENKVCVVPLAPATLAYSEPTVDEVHSVRQKFDLPEAFMFYPAQTWPHKNHIGLLEALSVVRKRYGMTIPLVSSGKLTEFSKRIQQRARELGLMGTVRFLGFVEPKELYGLYKLCRCVVIPTKFEAASFLLWEAFQAGAPAACSNVTSLPEQAGDAALVFDPDNPDAMADVIYRLWTDKELRRNLVDSGKKNVARYSWEKTAQLFRAHYRRIAGRAMTVEDRELIQAHPLL